MSAAEDLCCQSEEDARRILRQRTKATRTTRTSCFPCRSRKVRCNKHLPCDTCVKRGYPDLCTYTRPSQGSFAAPTSGATTSEATKSPVCHVHSSTSLECDASIQDQRSTTETPCEDEGRRDRFLGTNSIPAFLKEQNPQLCATEGNPASTIEGAILPILGLESATSPYPFVHTSQGPKDHAFADVEDAVPLDRDVISLFQCYRSESHFLSPIIPDIEAVEHELCKYLDDRAAKRKPSGAQADMSNQPHRAKSEAWMSSLFAVLASGVQYSNLPSSERQTRSRMYMKISFQCLRMANFLARPSLLCLQTLLILGNVLQNDMQPEVAWILLGTTGRIAQSLGLHQEPRETSPESLIRRKLWQAAIWQDSLLSLCFDRTPVTTPVVINREASIKLSYVGAMQALSNEALVHMRTKSDSTSYSYLSIFNSVQEIERIRAIYDSNQHSTIQERCESNTLRLHTSFVLAWICRPALRKNADSEFNSDQKQQLIEKCHQNLIDCVRAFIQLHNMRALASRSWTILHNGLSSALLMSLLNFGVRGAEVHQLQGEIIKTLSVDDQDSGMQTLEKDDEVKLSGPHTRILAVLKKLYQDKNQSDPAADAGNLISCQPHTTTIDSGSQQPPLEPGMNAFQNFDPVWLMTPVIMNGVDSSPLDYFDNLIWDTGNGTESYQDQNFGIYGEWTI